MTEKNPAPEPPGRSPQASDPVVLPAEPPDQAIARLEAERDQLKDRYLRLAAEYENYKKRTTKERAEAWVRAQAELVTRLADALDDLSRFAHVDPATTDSQTLHEGVELVERKMWKELSVLGVTRIDATGVPFDPNVHEAVTTQPAGTPEEDHQVGQVLQAGYRLGETLLRPARVIVLTWQGGGGLMAPQRDYYQVLGVAETATTDEIKKAFRRLAKQHHPDRNPNKPQSAERFKEINEAHDVLSDADKRKKYDQLRRYGAFAGAGGGDRRGGGPGAGDSGADFDLSDLGSFGGLGDIFSSIFGRRGGAKEPDVEEIETTVAIPFRVAALGGKIPITLTLSEVCPTCGGNGAAPGATISTCPECKGRGTISFGQGGFAVNRPCPVCRGKGTVPSKRCGTCQGSGEVRVEKQITVTIPPGTEDGTRLRLKDQGAKGRGDVVVQIQVEPDRFFRREGLDVICVVPITMAQAILGSRIKVKTLDGKKVVIKLPPGTQHGQKFRIPGQGIEKNGRRGDQYVDVHVEIPEHLTEDQQEAFKAFAEKAGLKY